MVADILNVDKKEPGILDFDELDKAEWERANEVTIPNKNDASSTQPVRGADSFDCIGQEHWQVLSDLELSGTIAVSLPDVQEVLLGESKPHDKTPLNRALSCQDVLKAHETSVAILKEELRLEGEAERRKRLNAHKEQGIQIAEIIVAIPWAFKAPSSRAQRGHMGTKSMPQEDFFVELLIAGIARINKFMHSVSKESLTRVEDAWKIGPTLVALEIFFAYFVSDCFNVNAVGHCERIIMHLGSSNRSLHALISQMLDESTSQSAAQSIFSQIEKLFEELTNEAIRLSECIVAPSDTLQEAMSRLKGVLLQSPKNMTPQLATQLYAARTPIQYNEVESIIRRTNLVTCTCLLHDLRAGIQSNEFQSRYKELRTKAQTGKSAEAEMNYHFLHDLRAGDHTEELRSQDEELLSKVQAGKSAYAEMVNSSFMVQKSVLPRYGFPATAEGVRKMREESGLYADGFGLAMGCNGDKTVAKLRWDIHKFLDLYPAKSPGDLVASLHSPPVLLYHCKHKHGFFSMFSLVLGHLVTCEANLTALYVDWSDPELLYCGPPGQPNLWQVFFKQPAEVLMTPQLVRERLAKQDCTVTEENLFVYGAFKGVQESNGEIPPEFAAHGRALCRKWIHLESKFEEKLRELEDELLGEGMRWLAVHIRRGDKAVEAASNLLLTETAIVARVIDQCFLWKMDGVFLCSDDAKLKIRIEEQLGHHAAPSGAALMVSSYASTLTLNEDSTHKDTSLDGFIKAEDVCTEAFLMARCCHGLLSTYSNVSASVVYLSPEGYPYTTFFDSLNAK